MALSEQQTRFMEDLTRAFHQWGISGETLITLGRLADNRDYSGAAIDGADLEAQFEVTKQQVGQALTLVDEFKLFLDGTIGATGLTGWQILDVIRRL